MAATLAALLLTAVGCLAFTWQSARRTRRDLDRARRLLGETAEVAARAIREQAVTRPARACPRWWRRTPHRQPPAAVAAAVAAGPGPRRRAGRPGRMLTLAAAGLVAGVALSAAPSVSPGRVDPHAAAAPAGPPVRVPQPAPDTSPGPQPPPAAATGPADHPLPAAASDRHTPSGGTGTSPPPEPSPEPEPQPEPGTEPEPPPDPADDPDPLLLCADVDLLGLPGLCL